MPTPRKEQIDLSVTRHYHCISRCVRRAFLCGYDNESQRHFDHRKQWLVDLMHQLVEIFAIRICAYAVMSNHYHLILSVDLELALSWSDEEVVDRWAKLYPTAKNTNWSDIETNFKNLSSAQHNDVTTWRNRLYNISWFMRKLNEFIARRANSEDQCTGHFWESRFKSQALLDDSALLACMVYVDLNPIRAGICNTPESSDFTSIQERLKAYQQEQSTTKSLCDFEDETASENTTQTSAGIIPCTRKEYFELVDATGRLVRADKSGAIPADLEPILTRVSINADTWLDTVESLETAFARFIGRPDKIEERREALGKPRLHGFHSAKKAFTAPA